MKIAILTGGACALPPEAIGAVEILWYDIGRILASRGHSVVMVGKGSENIVRDGPNFVCKVYPGFNPSARSCGRVWQAFWACVKMLRMIDDSDVLVSNNVWGAVLAPLLIRRKYRALVVNVQRMPKAFFSFFNFFADMLACPSTPVATAAVRKMGEGWRNRVVVIPNPINVESFNPEVSRRVRIPQLIVYHGRVNREKGLHILAKAVSVLAARYSGLKLKIVGAYDVAHGGSGDQYKKELDLLSGGRIEWHSPISNRELLADELSEGQLYCYPSIAERGETFGVSPLEAMGLGLPTVVSALDCFKDFVEDGKSGLVFDHNSENPAEILANKLDQLLSNEEMRDRIGKAGAMVAAEFSNVNVANKYEELFDGFLK